MNEVEFTGVILASTCGARLFPITNTPKSKATDTLDVDVEASDAADNEFMPKHLLPLAGRPLIHHLLQHCRGIGMEKIIVVISADDDKTKSSLMQLGCKNSNEIDESTLDLDFGVTRIYLMRLPAGETGGSAEAMRCVIGKNLISPKSHVMVLPGDLVLYGQLVSSDNKADEASGTSDSKLAVDALGSLADVHRREYRHGLEKGMPLAMSLILSDIGEEDENGVPLKESAKAKKGGISREEQEIEFIGIATIKNDHSPPTNRIILKEPKLNVEEDVHNTGSTPKLYIPKARMHSPMNQMLIKTTWSDLHVFCFSPWALKLLLVNKKMKDLGKEFVPFLVSRQFRGVKSSFGLGSKKGAVSDEDTDAVEALIETMNELKLDEACRRLSMTDHGIDRELFDDDDKEDYPFLVSAQILSRKHAKLSLRSSTLTSYAYACREVITNAIAVSKAVDESKIKKGKRDFCSLYLPENTQIDAKNNSIILPESTLGEKVVVKSSTIGKGVSIGGRCRLNNVIIHDNVKIGENCVLQNTTISEGCIIGDNCNLNNCQLRTKASIPTGTKSKGESF